MDSLESTASDDIQPAGLADAEADEDSSNEAAEVSTPDVNTDAIRASIEAARAQADLESVKRAAGHIPGLQRELAQLKGSVAKITDLEQTNQQLTTQVNGLLDFLAENNLLSDRAVQSLRPQRGADNADLVAAVRGLQERMDAGPSQPEVDPEAIAYKRQADAATEQVFSLAKAKGYDANQIPDEVWTKALNANRGDFTAAVVDVVRYVDGELAKQSRRAERADAASGGVGERSARKGALTLDAVKKMSVEEVRSLPAGEIDRLLAGN